MSPKEFFEFAKKHNAKMMDLHYNALEEDHDFLTKGDVFSEALIQSWINWKRSEELDPLALRPHPYEFHLYYDS